MTQPTDEQLINALRDGLRLREICDLFSLPWCYFEDGVDFGYTKEAKAVRYQLQRLRLAGKLRQQGGKWRVR